jgi:hypothetical protein
MRGDPRAPEWLGAGAVVDGPELRASDHVAEVKHRTLVALAPVMGMLAQILGADTPDPVARGARSEYHMRRGAWLPLLTDALGPEIHPLGARTALSTPHADLFALHLGRIE